jgi:hypothetical protein
MSADISAGASILLPDGGVFISGQSFSFAAQPIPGATGALLLYNPATDTFSAPMTSRAQWGQSVTLLPDGTVLQAGGYAGDHAAELYHPGTLVPTPQLLAPGAIVRAGIRRAVSADDPAVRGEFLELSATGLIDGSVIAPQVVIGGVRADVLSFGKVSEGAAHHLTVRIPAGIRPGAAAGVRMTYLSRPSNEITISVR